MLETVASALGPSLLGEVAFVGGCTTGLLVTDEFSRQGVRFTDDVDLIVSVIGKGGWYKLRDQLINSGFRESAEDDINCRLRLGELKVDFMPDDEAALGFSNRWYREALATATWHQLNSSIRIKVVTPPYYVATKLEAYKGRGRNDPLGSHDIEDMLTLIDGRPELLDELTTGPLHIANYIALELQALLSHNNFDYAIKDAARNDSGREELLFTRIEKLALQQS